jgi:hypothetical protein
MDKKNFQVPAILSGITFKVDGGLSLRFTTNELTTPEKVGVGDFINQFGYLLFAPNEFEDADIPKNNTPSDLKPPSQRLRGVLYLLWEKFKVVNDFDIFYKQQMEMIIQHYKDKLDA